MAIMSKDFYQVNNINSDNELPLLKDYLINLDTGETIIDEKTGDGIIVEGIDAVVVQAKRKLMTQKRDPDNFKRGYPIFDMNYGSAIDKLNGKSIKFVSAVAYDYIYQCLVDDLYITNIEDFKILRDDDSGKYIFQFVIVTPYGNQELCDYISKMA